MPIYEYLCPDGHRFEVVQRFSDDPVALCEVCGKPVQRVLFAPAVHYKGKGFYSTDYGRKGANGAKPDGAASEAGSKEGSSGNGSDSAATSDSKGSDSKSSEAKSSDSKSSGDSSSAKKSDASKPAA